jgi:hypothetical protein
MKYIFEKSILTELISGGCKRSVVNRLDNEWRDFAKPSNLPNENYVINKLGLKNSTFQDKPPLASYQEEGKIAETNMLIELSLKNKIGTSVKSDSKNSYNEFAETTTNGTGFVFNKVNEKILKDLNKRGKFDNKDFRVDFTGNNKDLMRFCSIMDPKKYNYIYQLKFDVLDNFYFPLIKDNTIITELKKYEITFQNFIPDFIKIIPSSTSNLFVFDKDFNTVLSSKDKTKLQVCDIKMSEFSNKFFVELGLYMLALNSFIFSNGLDSKYEIVSEGIIFPQKDNESEKEIDQRLSLPNYKTPEWICKYDSIRDKMFQLFNKEIFEVITLIENGDINQFNKIKISAKCQTCDYYGGQHSDNLKRYIEKLNREHNTNITIDQFYNDPNNNYCRYTVLNSDSINRLSCLKPGGKNVLINNSIVDLNSLNKEVNNPMSKVFNENISLKSEIEMIENHVDVKNKSEEYRYLLGSKTLNLPSFSNLKIFIDERHDSQSRSLSFSFIYIFNGADRLGNNLTENNFKEPYIAIIDDESFTLTREKREFLDFLIEINKLLDKYEVYSTKFGGLPTFAIIYWGDKAINHFRDMFLGVFKYIRQQGNGIEEIYSNLKTSEIEIKRKEVNKLFSRFNSFFTSDDELEDYRVVEKSPFFDLKSAVNDILAVNCEINHTLYQVHNLLIKDPKAPYFHKPDSDDFNGAIFSNVWKKWINNAHKRAQLSKVANVIKDRLFMLYNISSNIDNGYCKGQAPAIPKLQRISAFPGLKFGLDLYLLHKLDSAYSLIEKESIHNERVHKKTVLGKSMLLKKELIGNSKEQYLKNYLGNSYISSEHKVYEIDNNSVDANFDEKTFGLMIYPADKHDFIHKKFSEYQSPYTIYYDKTKDLAGMNFFEKDNGQTTTKTYKKVIQVSIAKFDRFAGIIILKLERDTPRILEFLEKRHSFDFSKDVILEVKHIDIWEGRLKKYLENVESSQIAKDLFEAYDNSLTNSYTAQDVESTIMKHIGQVTVPLDPSQIRAIYQTLNQKLTLLWGPPGTGKSYTVSYLVLFYYLKMNQGIKRILVLGNYDATDNIIKFCGEVLDNSDVSITRIKTKGRENGNFKSFSTLTYLEFVADEEDPNFQQKKDAILKQKNKLQIFTSTPDQVMKVFKSRVKSFSFDLVIIDEASQMDVGHFSAGLYKITDKTQFLLAGDNLQLQPITKVKLKEPSKNIYGSVFDYYDKEFSGSFPTIKTELLYNRRSNRVIVDFCKYTFNYPSLYIADKNNSDGKISFTKSLNKTDFYDKVINPEYPMVVLNYNDGNSSQLNVFEAEEVVKVTKNAWEKGLCNFESKNPYDLFEFFDKGIGIVVPHRAQRTKIQNALIDYFNSIATSFSNKDMEKLREKIISSVDTVEKYQGQQREIMICSYVLGDEDVINLEEEFIYNPNRLNVMISRARFKVIVLASNELISNISDELEIITLQESLKQLVGYCTNNELIVEKDWMKRNGIIRYRTF